MKSFICMLFLAIVSTGCSAALQEKLSTDTLWDPDAKEPSVSEHPVGVQDHFGTMKRLIIQNPLTYPINATVKCMSMFQPDIVAHVRARRQRYYLITAPYTRSYDQTCYLFNYEAAEN